MSHPGARAEPDEIADEELLRLYREGDDRAFATLFQRYRDRVTSYAWRMTGRHEEGEEVCIDAFARIVEGAWKPTGSFRSFLFTVVHRLCVDRLRRRARVAKAEPRLRIESGGLVATPEDATLDTEDRVRLETGLAALPEAHRAVLLLYYGQELTSAEVANVLECTDQQVRSRLSYARRLLREQLGEEVDDG